MLNLGYVSEITQHGSGSRFYWVGGLDKRDGDVRMTCSTSVADMITAINNGYNPAVYTATAYRNNNPTRGTYSVAIPSSKILMLYSDPVATRTWLKYEDGGTENTLLVNASLSTIFTELTGVNGDPISAVVENAAPTNVVLTFPTAKTSLGASDFTATINGTADTITNATWVGAVLTLTLTTAVVYGDVVVIMFIKTGQVTNVANNIVWYLQGDISSANCIAAYKFRGADDINSSFINLANPGIYDLSSGVNPDFYNLLGLVFNGSSHYKKTGIVPINNQTWSMLVRFSGYPKDADRSMAGVYETYLASFYTQMNKTSTSRRWGNGGTGGSGGYVTSGVMGFAGERPYFNGIDIGGADLPSPSGNIPREIFIGALNYLGNPIQYWQKGIQAIAIYDTTLTPTQMLAVSTAMNYMNNEKSKEYVNQKFGAFICWNMSTFQNLEWAYADVDVDTFAPTDLDIDNWLDAISDANMKYATLTVKHHDGFCLWPTEFADPGHDPYSIAQTTWYAANGSPDIVKLFTDGCNTRGIKPCLYYSIWDKTHEARSGTDDTTDAAAYIAMIEMQLTELLTNYGDIYAIWFDGWDWGTPGLVPSYTTIPFKTIYDLIKGLQSDIIILSNDKFGDRIYSEVEIIEGWTDPVANNIYPTEVAASIRTDGTWFHNNTSDQTDAALVATATLQTSLQTAIERNACVNISLSPDRTGHLPPAQITKILNVGSVL